MDTMESDTERADLEDVEYVSEIKEETTITNYMSLKCPQCDLVFQCIIALDNHIRFHTKEHPFQCGVCFKSFLTDSELYAHRQLSPDCSRKVKHDETLKCDICKRVLSSAYALMRHKRLHTGERPYQCVECKECFIDAGLLSKHMRTHNGHSILQCDVCGKVCVSEKRLAAHMFQHNGKKRYQCPVCDKRCRCKSHLDDHLRIHSGEKPFECAWCGVAYRYKSQLREHHLSKHSASEVYDEEVPPGRARCEICGAIVSHSSLRHHKLIHKNKDFKCDRCNKSYATSYRLTVHQRSHTGDRPFKCQVPGCGKAMSTKDGLLRHMVIHEGKKSFKCQLCDREFFFKSNLNQHLKTHSKVVERFPCERCGKVFSRKSALKTHLLSPCTGVIVMDARHPTLNVFKSPVSKHLQPSLLTKDSNRGTSSEQVVFPDSESNEMLAFQTQSPVAIFDDFNLDDIEINDVTSSPHDAVPESQTSSEHSYYNPNKIIENDERNAVHCKDNQNANLEYQSHVLPVEETTSSQTQPIKVKYPTGIELTDDNISNLMTLAGVSMGSKGGPAIGNKDGVAVKVVYNDDASDSNFNQVKVVYSSAPEQIASSAQEQTYSPSPNETDTSHIADNPKQSHQSSQYQDSHNASRNSFEDFDAEEAPQTLEDQDSTLDLIQKLNTTEPQKDHTKSNDSAEINANEEQKVNNGTYIHKCLHCDSMFRFHYALEEHSIEHHPGQDIYKCFDCPSTFDSTRSLLRHSRVHNGNSSVQCLVCDRMFSHPQKLTSHMMKHFGDRVKRFQCDTCGHRFSDSTHLRDHMMVHSGIKPFECSECDRKFTRKREWETHMRVHTGESPYSCTKCDKSFRAATYLRNHMLTHSESKPFQCTECDKGYVRRSKLRLHMMNHLGNKPFKCNEPGCGKSYCEKREFIHHSMTHRGEKPYQCKVCHKAFTMKGNMVQHEKKHNRS